MSNWYKISSIMNFPSKGEYVNFDSDYYNSLSEEEQYDYVSEKGKKRNEWISEIQKSISLGLISPKEAHDLGYYDVNADDIQELPLILYHVTTAKTNIINDRIRSRKELSQSLGMGLGGGDSETISFTDSFKIAYGIYRAMIEANSVAKNNISVEDMIKRATIGEGAKSPWINDIMSYYKIRDGEELEKFIFNLSNGYKEEHSILPESLEEFNSRMKDYSGEWEPVIDSGENNDGENVYTRFRVKLSESDRLDRIFSFYKAWSAFREHNGGQLNPLFFLSDVSGFSMVPADEIAILEFRANPGAMGYQVNALGEWRTWSGDAVSFVREIPIN